VLLAAAADNAEYQSRVGAFLQALTLSGWSIGGNLRVDTRWATPNAANIHRHAAELAALAPDVILAHGAGPVGALLQATRAVPIVFPVLGDPVGAGFVDSLARPGGNATGFMNIEFSMGSGWNCSRRSRQARRGRRSCGIPPKVLAPASLRSFKPWRRRSGWRSTRSTCATLAKSNAPSRRSPARAVAA
jgi:hypothetical protein